MNERLRELMVEAGYVAPELASRAQKLSDLIVRECLSLIPDECPSPDGRHVFWVLKDHFGIEE